MQLINRYALMRRCYVAIFLLLCWFVVPSACFGQGTEKTIDGFFEIDTGRLRLVTDVPIDDDLRAWPDLLEQSVEQWAEYFDVPSDRMRDWKATVYLISNRERFQGAGLLDGVPSFADGHQIGDRLFLMDQPSVYYRRHLFLHEATHWIMYRLYGGNGPLWFMEGMAELQGTHALQSSKLQLGIIPKRADQVPYWGRLRLIEGALEQKTAPSLSEILSFDPTRGERMQRYAWSWAAAVFFDSHPEYAPIVRELSRSKLDYSMQLSKDLRRRLDPQWPSVVADWNGFISDLDFGYESVRSMVSTSAKPVRELSNESIALDLDTSKGWQSTGISVRAGRPISIKSSGEFVIRNDPSKSTSPWNCQSQGVTVEYIRGKPLGQLIATVVSIDGVDETKRWTTESIGSNRTLVPQHDGILFLKVNEPAGELSDNQGSLKVEISLKRK